VYPTTGPGAPIDLLLADAYIEPYYDSQERPTAAERIARLAAREQEGAMRQRMRAEREQLAYELDMTCALVLAHPNAAAVLARLVNRRDLEPEGALVFGSLLHLTGRDQACRFWWQFAAGSGNHLAAYCLYLHHGRAGRDKDAEHWRAEAKELRAGTRPAVSSPRPRSQGPLLARRVYLDILAQCYRGNRPQLPVDVEAVINQLLVECDDIDFGEIPQPSPQLHTALLARAA
jgi:hypothetical protein